MKNILDELSSLIEIRQYVVNATANPTIDKSTVKFLNNALIMLDKKIIGLLQCNAFLEYINYSDIQKAIKEVVETTNIKSGLQRNPLTGQLEKIPK